MLKRPRLPTRREPRQGRALATRRTILTAAAKALRDEGADVGMTRIAEISGYGIGTIYEYFPNRHSLLCELMHQTCEDELAAMVDLMPGMRGAPLPIMVERVITLLVRWADDHRVLTRLVAREVVPSLGPDGLEDLLPAVAGLLAGELRARADETTLPSPELVARVVLTAAEAVVEDAAINHPEWLATPEFTREVIALVGGYLGYPRSVAEDARVSKA